MSEPVTRRGDREGRRRDILRAASELLEAEGYDGFHMREIARGAGVSAGTLYSYFQTKEHIFADLATEEFGRLRRRIEKLSAEPGTGFTRLLEALLPDLVHFHGVFGKHFSTWVRSRQKDADGSAEYMKPFETSYLGMMGQLEDSLRRAADRDGQRLDASPLCMRLIWSTIVGLADEFVHRRHEAHSYDPEALTRYASSALLAALSR